MTGKLGCGGLTAKYILFLFNITIFLCACVIVGTSLWLYLNEDTNEFMSIITVDRENKYLKTSLLVLLVMGLFIFMVGFLGCCGACKENTCMLNMYAAMLILVIIGEILGVGLALYSRSKMEESVETSMAKQAKELNPSLNYTLTKYWSHMQYKFKCCGGTDYKDYQNSKIFTETGNRVPETCCKLSNDDPYDPQPVDYAACNTEAANTNPTTQLYSQGCYDGMVGWVKENIGIVVGVCFGIIVIEIIGILFACCIKNQLNEYNKV